MKYLPRVMSCTRGFFYRTDQSAGAVKHGLVCAQVRGAFPAKCAQELAQQGAFGDAFYSAWRGVVKHGLACAQVRGAFPAKCAQELAQQGAFGDTFYSAWRCGESTAFIKRNPFGKSVWTVPKKTDRKKKHLLL